MKTSWQLNWEALEKYLESQIQGLQKFNGDEIRFYVNALKAIRDLMNDLKKI